MKLSPATRRKSAARRKKHRREHALRVGVQLAVLLALLAVGIDLLLERQRERTPVSAPVDAVTEETAPEPEIEPEPINYPTGEPGEGERVVYLTIDDGPCSNTGKLLDLLDEYRVQATWFVTAQYRRHDDLVDTLREIENRGHTVAIHSSTHDYEKIYASPETFLEDYDRMADVVEEALGTRPKLIRLPGGSNTGYNEEIRQELLDSLRQRGLVWCDWNAFIGDTERLSVQDMKNKAIRECRRNDKVILLMHDCPGKGSDLEALPEIFATLQAEGYQFRKLDPEVIPIQFAR